MAPEIAGRPLWVAIALVAAAGALLSMFGWGMAVALGVAAPVFTSVFSWLSVARAWAIDPGASLGVMVRGFLVKAVFFVAWVAIALKGFEVRPEPFVASLTVSFVVLHVVHAWCLQRLMQT